MRRRLIFIGALLFICCVASSLAQASILVGRISHIDGEMLKYVESDEDWVATAPDSPVGAGDVFYTYEGSKAELIMPNSMEVRIGGLTEIDIVALETHWAEIFVNAGIVRVYNHARDSMMRVGTPYGDCLISYQGVVDFYVGDELVEVVPLDGTVDFIRTRHDGSEERYEAVAGSFSLLVDAKSVAAGEGYAAPEWDAWCRAREYARAEQLRTRSPYLPDRLQEYAYTLENYGVWDRIHYKGYDYWCWRPLYVQANWEPYTVGRWTEWHDDQVWVPYEPWGWCTHHYGYWLNIGGAWWWTPYYVGETAAAGVQIVGTGFSFGPLFWPLWHPARVAWISTSAYVGWVPLAPWETCYGWRNWGYNTVVVTSTALPAIWIDVGAYAYLRWAVVIPHRYFYGFWISKRRPYGYGPVRVRNVSTTVIVNKYHGAPVFHNTVIRNYKRVSVRHRYSYVNKRLRYKPHKSVINGINARKKIRKIHPPTRAVTDRERLERIPRKRIARFPSGSATARPQTITGRIVRTRDVNKPANRVDFGKTNLKGKHLPTRKPPGQAREMKDGKGERRIQPQHTKERLERKVRGQDSPYRQKERPRPPSQSSSAQKERRKQPPSAQQGKVNRYAPKQQPGAKQGQTQPQRRKQPPTGQQGKVNRYTPKQQPSIKQGQTQP
ncbi:MAG: hypothetical protein JRJ60_04140, partial [Deltaproteobacteria bacterium]|nr:hypothetical protein [Deltaproteobacteria bacterium]